MSLVPETMMAEHRLSVIKCERGPEGNGSRYVRLLRLA